jgi:hypothetical protein
LEACTPETCDAFRADLSTAEKEASTVVVPKQASAQDGHWQTWEKFISTFPGIDPYLAKLDCKHKLCFLQVFARLMPVIPGLVRTGSTH